MRYCCKLRITPHCCATPSHPCVIWTACNTVSWRRSCNYKFSAHVSWEPLDNGLRNVSGYTLGTELKTTVSTPCHGYWLARERSCNMFFVHEICAWNYRVESQTYLSVWLSHQFSPSCKPILMRIVAVKFKTLVQFRNSGPTIIAQLAH